MSTDNPYEPPHAATTDAKPATPDPGNAAIGVLLALLGLLLIGVMALAGAAIATAFGLGSNAQMTWMLVPVMFFGAFQFIYIVPLALYLRARGKSNTALGVWITAGVLFMLNASCYGILLTSW